MAVLRFENLSGSVADDWQGRALSDLLARRFHATRMPYASSPAPGISSERLAALSTGATKLVTGYYTAVNGRLSVTAFAEDASTQKLTGPLRAAGDLASVLESLANQLGAPRDTAQKSDSAALKEYALARDASGPGALQHYELAMQADPKFAPAYSGSVEAAVLANDVARARTTLTLASSHSADFSAEDRANLQLQSANIWRDVAARTTALQALLALDPTDQSILRTLADAEMSSHRAGEAAKHYRELVKNQPRDSGLQNLLAYSSLFAGDETGARAAAAEYFKLSATDPNAFDTRGDVELGFGHFAEAEKIYLASPDPSFQDFSPSWKAARARLLSGDVAGANTLFEKHRTLLGGTGNPAAAFRAAEWLSLKGENAAAMQAMVQIGSQASQPRLKAMAYTQAGIWAVASHDLAHAVQWSDIALHPAETSTFNYAALARFLAQPPTDAAGWQRRAEANFQGANAGDVARLALGYALFLSGDKTQSVTVWKQIYENSNVNDVGAAYLYGWSLLNSGRPAAAAPFFRLAPIPASAIGPSFEALYVPHIAEWRKTSLRQ